MIILELEQGSPEWHEVRMSHRTASETPAVLGIKGAFNSPNDIRKYKRGIKSEGNAAMRHGNKYEETARQNYAELYEPIKPLVCKDGDYLASLDGINEAMDTIVEIKCPFKGKESALWIEAAGGFTVPEHYWYQVQHQLMVTKAARAWFFVFDAFSGDSMRLEVLPDETAWQRITTAWDEFWPTIAQRDDSEWASAARDYLTMAKIAAEANKALDEAKTRLRDLSQGQDAAGCGVKVQRVERTGTVDWKAVQTALLQDVDLEPYRKAGSVEYRVSTL